MPKIYGFSVQFAGAAVGQSIPGQPPSPAVSRYATLWLLVAQMMVVSFMKQLFGTSSYYWQQVGVLGALLGLFSALFGFLYIQSAYSENQSPDTTTFDNLIKMIKQL